MTEACIAIEVTRQNDQDWLLLRRMSRIKQDCISSPTVREYTRTLSTLNHSQSTTEQAVNVAFDQSLFMRPFPATRSGLGFVRIRKRSQ
jgi:hypothetical protein